jgi:DNA-binding MarR family transcriptional regulator
MPLAVAGKAALARKAWRLMFHFMMRTAPERTRKLGRRGLTPNDSRALFSLDPEEGRTMGALAEDWECDASNATWIVDRLERLGLAERRTIASDRRVKLVVLTPKGARTKAELLRLDRADLEALHRALGRLPPD